jgi:hypothetical protein
MNEINSIASTAIDVFFKGVFPALRTSTYECYTTASDNQIVVHVNAVEAGNR